MKLNWFIILYSLFSLGVFFLLHYITKNSAWYYLVGFNMGTILISVDNIMSARKAMRELEKELLKYGT